MTLPSTHALGELWYEDMATTPTETPEAASTFVATATKLSHFDLDISGLKQEVVADRTVQTAPDGKPGDIDARRPGEFNFKVWLEGGATATTSPGVLATMLGAAMGGLTSPNAITDAAEATSTATRIKATAHGYLENEGIMIGVVGDARAAGKVGFIADATGTGADDFDVQIDYPVAPNAADVIKAGHTLFLDYTDESYFDFLFIGAHAGTGATDDPDSCQMIRCSLSGLEFGGFDEGAPWVQLTFRCGDWAWVNYASQATFAHTTAASGAGPIGGAEAGSLCLQDAGTTTRNQIAAGGISVAIPITLQPIRDAGYTNGIKGWVKVPNAPGVGPTIKFTPYFATIVDMPGLYNDMKARTAKQVQWQVGTTAQSVVAFYIQSGTLRAVDPSKRVALEDNTGLELEVLGSNTNQTDLSTAAKRLMDAAIVVWLG